MSSSDYMAANLSQIQQTVSIAMLKSAQATQAASAQVMLEKMVTAQQAILPAPHPYAGNVLDIRL